jgi:hypothetical protein
MGNGFVVEAALTLLGVCAIDFVQIVVQVFSLAKSELAPDWRELLSARKDSKE